jgi:hypothetical protein
METLGSILLDFGILTFFVAHASMSQVQLVLLPMSPK